MRGRLLRALLVLLAALLTTFAIGAGVPASAHAYLDSSNPADGSRVEQAPRTLRLRFSEHVVESATRIRVVDSTGHRVPVSAVHVVSGDPEDTEEPATVVATLPRLGQSAYRVSWETLSSDDLHRTSGLFAFGVGETVQPTKAVEPLPRVDEAGLRAVLLTALALLLGGLLAGRVLRRAGVASSLPRRLTTYGGLAALGVSALLLAVQVLDADARLRTVLLSAYGVRWLVRSAGLVALTVAGRHRPSRRRTATLALAVVATTVGTASLGHAGSGQVSPTRLLADAAHLGATLAWGGAVLVLALTLLRAAATDRTSGALHRGLVAFAAPAAGCLAVAVVTGVYLASSVVGSVDAALETFYGRALILKLVAVGAAAGLGLVNHLRLRHGPHGHAPRRTVPAEALAVVGVVLLTAVLTSAQPATEPAYVDRAVSVSTGQVDRQVADVQLAVGLRPNRPGDSVAVVDAFNTRRPAPAQITGIDLALSGATVALQPVGDGHWSAPVRLTQPGRTPLTVTVHRAGLRDVVGRFPWTVATGVAPPRTLVSRAPLRDPLRLLAASLAGLLVAVAGALLWVDRRRRRPAADASPAGPGATGDLLVEDHPRELLRR